MLLEDELNYPKYQRVVDGNSKYKPQELKHVFDTTTGGYVSNEFNCCYYSPIDITGLTFSSNNNNIIVDDDILISEKLGPSIITGYNTKDEEVLSFKVISYRDKIPNKKFKNTLLLQLNNMIPINTVLKHINCPHYTDCIFEREVFKIYDNLDLFEVVYQINQLNQQIRDYQNIKEAYRNNDIIYHKGLKDCYNIRKIKNENNQTVIETSVVSDFIERIDSRIKTLRQNINDLKHMRRRLERK